MSLESAQTIFLIAATVTMGLMAGVFSLYAHTIMRGLGKTDDRTFVGAFQSIDRAIVNPLFMLTFFGALVFTGVATLLNIAGDDHSALPWLIAAFGCYLGLVVITVAVHLPLNDALKSAGKPDRIADLAAVRANFRESRWIAWNLVRVVANFVAFGCLVWALVLHGRATTETVQARKAAQSPATHSR